MGNKDVCEELSPSISDMCILPPFETAFPHNLIHDLPYFLCPNNLYLKYVSRSMHWAWCITVSLPIWHHDRTRHETRKNNSKFLFVSHRFVIGLLIERLLVQYPLPSCAASRGVSVVDVLLRIPLDLCSPSVYSAECSRNRVWGLNEELRL